MMYVTSKRFFVAVAVSGVVCFLLGIAQAITPRFDLDFVAGYVGGVLFTLLLNKRP